MIKRLLILSFVFLGIIEVITQTLYIREIQEMFHKNELSLGVLFGGWLFWGGIGTLIGRRIRKEKFVELNMVGSGVMVGEMGVIHLVREISQVGVEGVWHPVYMVGGAFFLFLPLGIILGMIFVEGCKLWAKVKKDKMEGVSRVYVLDAIGYIIGGWLFIVLIKEMEGMKILLMLGGINLGITMGLSFILKKGKLTLINLGGIILMIIGGVNSRKIEKYLLKKQFKNYHLINYRHSLYGKEILLKLHDLYLFYEGGELSFAYPLERNIEEELEIIFSQTPEKKRILLVGGGIGLVEGILKKKVEKVVWVRLGDGNFLTTWEEEVDLEKLKDRRLSIIYDDERRFVRNYKGEKFDIILIKKGDPSTAFTNRFYTLEFFKEMKKILSPCGVVSLEITSNPNYLSPEMLTYNGVVYHTLQKVLPQIVLLPGETLKLIASKTKKYLTSNIDTLQKRIPPTFHYLLEKFSPFRLRYIKTTLDTFHPSSYNTDFHPISYYYDLILKGGYFSVFWVTFFKKLSSLPFWVLFLGIIFITIGIIKKTSLQVSIIGILGVSSMGGQVLLLLCFQAIYGYMYHKIGMITGSFMLGLALGGRFMTPQKKRLLQIEWGMIFYLGVALFLAKVTQLTGKGEWVFYFIPVIGGWLVGGGWRVANYELLKKKGEVGKVVGLLGGVDLLSSAIGGIWVSVFLVPIYGIEWSFITLMILNLIPLLVCVGKI